MKECWGDLREKNEKIEPPKKNHGLKRGAKANKALGETRRLGAKRLTA
jgi:hypothetical protein